MTRPASTAVLEARPALPTVLELLKPVTWFPPMWAFACGVVCSGESLSASWPLVLVGLALTGPLVCGTSQAINDWFDRDVDAINEPDRPIPSGRMPGAWGLYIAVAWTALSLAVAAVLGPWGFAAAGLGLAMAWAYSAPPLRLKRNGWYGNTAVALCYEGLPWFTGAAILATTLPDPRIIALAALYSFGAHGIMTLNDFKSIEGDRRMGIGSLPVRLGVPRAARTACAFMLLPQLVVIALLFDWGRPLHAAAIATLIVAQLFLMRRLLASPRERDYWYNAVGVPLFVAGMMISAFGVRPLLLGAST